MTKEEAIKILEEEAEFLYGGDEPYNKRAFDMAIEALTERNIARDIATIIENEQDMRVILKNAERPEVVRCKDCRHAEECHKSVHFTHNEPNAITIGYTGIYFCSNGERKGGGE